MVYTLDSLYIESVFESVNIHCVNIKIKPNLHPVLEMAFSVKNISDTDGAVKEATNSRLRILTYEREVLFNGIIKKCKAVYKNKTVNFKVEVLGVSVQLDEQKNIRLFQDTQLTYKNILEHIISEKSGKLISSKKDCKVGGLLLQYKETDWEFLKRISGLDKTLIVPSVKEDEIRLYYGLPDTGQEIMLRKDFYISGNVIKNVSEGCCHIEGAYHIFKDEKNYSIGTVVKTQEDSFVIYEKEIKTEGGSLEFYYTVCKPENIRSPKRYNSEIRGLVIIGEVVDTKEEDVFLQFDIDSGLEKTRYAFEWTPITGNVMYCMPEIGSKVKVYFSDRDERKNAFAIECVNQTEILEGTKGLITKSGKKMQLHNRGIQFDSKDKLKLSGNNVLFNTEGELSISAGRKVKLKSDMIEIGASKDIRFHKK